MRRLYGRDHLDHVLGTFGLILFFNELVRLVWGPAGLTVPLPAWLNTAVPILPGIHYPAYRIAIIVVALAVAVFLYLVVMRTRFGMLIRAGASNREMVGALGINIKLLYTLVFGIGAALAGLAGLMQAPILTVSIGMGENILILAFVVIIIGGIGSIRGAFVASIFVGPGRHRRARLPARAVQARHEPRRRLGGGAGRLVDADLSADGDRAGGAAGGPVPGATPMTALAHRPQRRRGRAARCARAGARLLPRDRQLLPAVAVHPHHHPGDGGGQPEPDHGLRRHGELRACRLHRHRRLCGRHPRPRGRIVRLRRNGRWRWPCPRCSRS